ncbi:MAG: hypothetical protein H7Y02_05115 [Candidatus Obscuribacterales bacterium]|nr:hypothetical protein [Steroidobacteraceae bacterium]
MKAIVLIVGALVVTSVHGQETATAARADAQRYTFSWPLDGANLKPRGGTTKGPSVTLDHRESPAWQSLQEKGLSSVERDRRAILAMAGTYRVTFDFIEITDFTKQPKPNAPYQSWGTEKVFVDIDQAKAVSLVHILEMRIVQQDGSISEPMVTKHWRQDWHYEPPHIVEHKGRNRWERRRLSAAESKGTWSQTVYQVDESPRYASVGRWQHSPSFSTWLSADTWRPLPRREWSVRDDYQVLIGTNRHTIDPLGWVQEENNLKGVLTAQGSLDVAQPYAAREYGVARYERIRDADFAAADHYYRHTKAFWERVRDSWRAAFAQTGAITLRGPVDKLGLFMPLFARAQEIADQSTDRSSSAAKDQATKDQATKDQEVIDAALRDMGLNQKILAK